MGYIKEPAGIDITVDPTPLTKEDRKNKRSNCLLQGNRTENAINKNSNTSTYDNKKQKCYCTVKRELQRLKRNTTHNSTLVIGGVLSSADSTLVILYNQKLSFWYSMVNDY
jgi:hypothetical protein